MGEGWEISRYLMIDEIDLTSGMRRSTLTTHVPVFPHHHNGECVARPFGCLWSCCRFIRSELRLGIDLQPMGPDRRMAPWASDGLTVPDPTHFIPSYTTVVIRFFSLSNVSLHQYGLFSS